MIILVISERRHTLSDLRLGSILSCALTIRPLCPLQSGSLQGLLNIPSLLFGTLHHKPIYLSDILPWKERGEAEKDKDHRKKERWRWNDGQRRMWSGREIDEHDMCVGVCAHASFNVSGLFARPVFPTRPCMSRQAAGLRGRWQRQFHCCRGDILPGNPWGQEPLI